MKINSSFINQIPPIHNIEPIKRNSWRLAPPMVDEAIKLAASMGNRDLFKDKNEEKKRVTPHDYPPMTLN